MTLLGIARTSNMVGLCSVPIKFEGGLDFRGDKVRLRAVGNPLYLPAEL
jgi:hypothetical protein